ncbi:MAG TPA: glycosyltransferase family 2 protein [Thermodesulfobacteriota bacterium]|nr:glycosyltransferase family 2 protein [Thermodesulfobacteriota bacterium]
MNKLRVPVVFILFNRPELTRQVFNVIREVRPDRLFLIADGPRINRAEDILLCSEARQVVESVDWECTVQKNYSEANLGCGRRIVSGLNWVFEQVDEAIILEDDILPDPTFFQFCSELLERYRNEPRVMYISGRNNLGQWNRFAASYFFCRHGNIWGWATWKRAWALYDFQMNTFRDLDVENILHNNLPDPEHAAHQMWFFRRHAGLVIDTWDAQWTLTCLLQGGLCIMPNINLVSNLGFQPGATHTTNASDMRGCLPSFSLGFPLLHPTGVQADYIDDEFDRWNFLWALMNTYRRVPMLHLWQRVIDKNPRIPVPGLNEGFTHVLTPLRHPDEALQVLHHMQSYVPANNQLEHLMEEFSNITRKLKTPH